MANKEPTINPGDKEHRIHINEKDDYYKVVQRAARKRGMNMANFYRYCVRTVLEQEGQYARNR